MSCFEYRGERRQLERQRRAIAVITKITRRQDRVCGCGLIPGDGVVEAVGEGRHGGVELRGSILHRV